MSLETKQTLEGTINGKITLEGDISLGNGGGMTAEQAQQLAQNTEDIKQLSATVNDLKENGTGTITGGMTSNAKTLLGTLLRATIYDKDVLSDPKTVIDSFLAELDKTVSPDTPDVPEEPDVPVDPDEPTPETYTVTYTLTDVTSSNKATTVTEGASYTTVLSSDSTIDTVTVKMGGVDITESAYNSSSNTITIAEITGDIVIIAKVGDASVLYTLKNASFDGTKFVDTGVCLEDEEKDFTIVANFIEKADSTAKHVVFSSKQPSDTFSKHLMLETNRTTVNSVNVQAIRFYNPSLGWLDSCFVLKAVDGETPVKGRVIITHAKDSGTITAYAVNDSNTNDTSFVNGVSREYALNPAIADTICVGGDDTGARGKFVGDVYEFTIYNRVLSADEISAYLA